jgi:DNA-binding NtrC family response regulator
VRPLDEATVAAEALRRIVSIDPARVAQLVLRLAREEAHARAGGLLAVTGQDYALVAVEELHTQDLQQIAFAWKQKRSTLLAGEPVVADVWAMTPVGEPTTALLYLGNLQEPPSRGWLHRLGEELGGLLETAVRLREQEAETRLMHELALAPGRSQGLSRERLALVLRACDGNITRAAKVLRVTRATVYNWTHRHRLSREHLAHLAPPGASYGDTIRASAAL